jgi:type II secretory pathway component PulK
MNRTGRAWSQHPSLVRTRRGTALLATLFAVSILATLTAMASQRARSSASIATNRRAQTVARMMAESGVVAARAEIEGRLHDALRSNVGDATALDAAFARLFGTTGDAGRALVQDSLDDGVFSATVVNASARLDLNTAGAEGIETLLRTTTDAGTARRIAECLDARVRGETSGETNGKANGASRGALPSPQEDALRARDSLRAVFTGTSMGSRVRRPFESLDEVQDFLGSEASVLVPVADLITVDGDGTIDRRQAPAPVLAAASGSLSDRPTRVVIIARGWQRGASLTREIQAVFAVQDAELRLVRWRELSR